MRNILFYLLVLLSYLSYGQTKDSIPIFEYEIRYSLGKALVKKGYVFKKENKIHFNTTKSVFLEKIKKFTENNDEGMPEINIVEGVVNENIITDLNKNKLFKLCNLKGKSILTEEVLKINQWKPTGVKKEISNRNCIELEGNFRGRDYIAYVDLEIPFYFGPWKLNNFPGLLVEVSDTKKQLSWKLLSIKNVSKSKINGFIKKQEDFFSSLKTISLKEFVPLHDLTKYNIFSYSTSRLPRDYKKRKSTKKKRRTGLELVYEWEEK